MKRHRSCMAAHVVRLHKRSKFLCLLDSATMSRPRSWFSSVTRITSAGELEHNIYMPCAQSIQHKRTCDRASERIASKCTGNSSLAIGDNMSLLGICWPGRVELPTGHSGCQDAPGFTLQAGRWLPMQGCAICCIFAMTMCAQLHLNEPVRHLPSVDMQAGLHIMVSGLFWLRVLNVLDTWQRSDPIREHPIVIFPCELHKGHAGFSSVCLCPQSAL